jgi:hypothetical protein
MAQKCNTIFAVNRARMPLHLLKLCVGVDDVDQLRRSQDARTRRGERLVHVTRNRPRRDTEVLDGGSLYWVIRRIVAVRQQIIGLEEVNGSDGIRRCAIILHPDLVLTMPQPRRPHQGWRYLEDDVAPADAPKGGPAADFPSDMAAELRELGLL